MHESPARKAREEVEWVKSIFGDEEVVRDEAAEGREDGGEDSELGPVGGKVEPSRSEAYAEDEGEETAGGADGRALAEEKDVEDEGEDGGEGSYTEIKLRVRQSGSMDDENGTHWYGDELETRIGCQRLEPDEERDEDEDRLSPLRQLHLPISPCLGRDERPQHPSEELYGCEDPGEGEEPSQ